MMSTAVVETDLVRGFDQVNMTDVASVGGKTLGEMYRELAAALSEHDEILHDVSHDV